MKILILGCGQVGSTIAQELSGIANNDITIIDTDAQALAHLGAHLDVQTIVGNGASPLVLERAGAGDTDMLIALTRSDETNLVACRMAEQFFNIPNRIARVRSADYLDHQVQDNEQAGTLHAFGVSETIHPEQLVTEYLSDILHYVRALQVLRFADDRVRLLIVQVRRDDPIVNHKIGSIGSILANHADCQISMVYRNNRMIVPDVDTDILEGDEICLVAATVHTQAVMRTLFNRQHNNHRIMIAGGGNIGYRLAKEIEHDFNIKIIEHDQERAEWLAENLDNALVLQGSASDENLLKREYIDDIDVFCALTNDDENNIMSSLLAKNLGAKRVISIINRSRYVDLLTGNQIDIVVSPHLITIGNVLTHTRRGHIVGVHPLRRGTAEAIEVIIHGSSQTSDLIGRRLFDIKWPDGSHVSAVIRQDEVLMGRENPVLQDGDHLILFVARRRVMRELEKLIQVKMGFFG